MHLIDEKPGLKYFRVCDMHSKTSRDLTINGWFDLKYISAWFWTMYIFFLQKTHLTKENNSDTFFNVPVFLFMPFKIGSNWEKTHHLNFTLMLKNIATHQTSVIQLNYSFMKSINLNYRWNRNSSLIYYVIDWIFLFHEPMFPIFYFRSFPFSLSLFSFLCSRSFPPAPALSFSICTPNQM